MSAIEASIENLTAEHTGLTEKLAQIDQQYRVERPLGVSQISRLAKALSALTGKPVAGAAGPGTRKMSDAGREAIRAGLEKSRAAKAASALQGTTPADLKSTEVVAASAAAPTPATPIVPDAGASSKKGQGSNRAN